MAFSEILNLRHVRRFGGKNFIPGFVCPSLLLFFNRGYCVSIQCNLLGDGCWGILMRLRACGGSRGIGGWLWFSCGIVHSRKSLIPIFQDFSSSIDRGFILAGGTGHWVIILCTLDSFLISDNFLSS